MVTPVLPPDVPIVGSSKVQPSWWRWFREVNAGLNGVSAGLNDVADLIAASQATVLSDVALTAGENIIAHGLGATPSTWWAARPRGAFKDVSVSSSIYLPPRPTRIVASGSLSSSAISQTIPISSQPEVGNHIMLQVMTEDNGTVGTYNSIASVSGSGVTWSFIGRIVYNPSSSIMYATELWIGEVTSAPISVITYTYSGTFGSSYYWSALAVEVKGASGVVSSIATGDLNSPRSGYPVTIFEDTTTTRSIFETPTPAPGQLLYCVLTDYATNAVHGATNGWDCLGITKKGTGVSVMGAYLRRAQYGEPYPLIMDRSSGIDFQAVYAVLETTDSPVSSSNSIEIPHGLREVSLNDTNLVIYSLSEVTVDFLFR